MWVKMPSKNRMPHDMYYSPYFDRLKVYYVTYLIIGRPAPHVRQGIVKGKIAPRDNLYSPYFGTMTAASRHIATLLSIEVQESAAKSTTTMSQTGVDFMDVAD